MSLNTLSSADVSGTTVTTGADAPRQNNRTNGGESIAPSSYLNQFSPEIVQQIARLKQQASTHFAETGQPFVTISYAQSLDGSIAAARGQPMALSSPESMALTHALRASQRAPFYDYVAIDAIAENILSALAKLPVWGVEQGLRLGESGASDLLDGSLIFSNVQRGCTAKLSAGWQLFSAGSSDWVVWGRPADNGALGYPADEAYFLHFIIHTMRGALANDAVLDPERFAHWIEHRHHQVERGELVYIAHQLDFMGQLV